MKSDVKHLDASIVLPEIPIFPWNSIDSHGNQWICIGYAQVFAQALPVRAPFGIHEKKEKEKKGKRIRQGKGKRKRGRAEGAPPEYYGILRNSMNSLEFQGIPRNSWNPTGLRIYGNHWIH